MPQPQQPNSWVGKMEVSKEVLDHGALVRLTNRAQAIAMVLAYDPLVPEKARAVYEEANECLKKAMRLALPR